MSSCTFVPLSRYDWSLHPALIPVPLPWNPTVYCLIAAFCGVSLWMSIELTVLIFATFQRRKSLYFWALLICTWGIVLHVLGLVFKLFNETNWILSSIIFKIGWVSNVTGFSFVLYSRLNLVVRNRNILRAVLCMICIDAVLFHIPIIVFDFGISSPHPNVWYMPMIIMEKIQVVGFSIQETIISLLYIHHASGFLKDVYNRKTHRVMQLLIFAQVVAIVFDICLITVDFNNMFTLKVIVHPFAYAIKLKLEFIVLNQLLALIKHGFAPEGSLAPDEESPDVSNPTPVRSRRRGDLSQIEASGTDYEKKVDPNSSLRVRNMDRMPDWMVDRADADVILPIPTMPRAVSQHMTHWQVTSQQVDPQQVEQSAALVQETGESHMPARSFSDPMPLKLTQREQDSEALVSAMERRYLGRFDVNST